MSTNKNFFKEQKEQSQVKATIIAKYFDVWSKVIIRTQKKYPQYPQKIAYIDLFAGPGRYEDGSVSTPLKILTNAVNDPDLCDRLVSIFNDGDPDNSKALESTISEIEDISKLKHNPVIWNQIVGEEIANRFEKINLIPTFFFVDPWGYKGLSLRLVNSVIKDWGCDSIFFFNYNRISMGLTNPKVKSHMSALFGNERSDILRERIKDKSPLEKELLIIEELCSALKEYGAEYVLPFRFKDARGTRTSHHLIFVCKDFKGYELMKEIMAKESSNHEDGVPSFEYDPADLLPKQTLLFKLSRPLHDLKTNLMISFKGQNLSMKDIYMQHNVDTPYIAKNYKQVLWELYDNKEISVNRSPKKPNTFADDIIVKFP